MTETQLAGLDVSQYQGYIDWSKVHSAGNEFAAVKATEGTWFTDPTFPHNWTALQRQGIRRIAYHFLHCNDDGAAQADYLHRYVRDHGRFVQGDAVMLDFEVMDGVTPFTALEVATDFVLRARERINKQVIVYTYPDFWTAQMGNPTDAVLSTCPLWLASYSDTFQQLGNWPVTSFWQYSSTGNVPGVQGEVDVDYFLGTKSQLRSVLAWPVK